MMRTLAFTTALALTAGAAFAQDPHAGHAGMHPQASAVSGIVTSPADGAMTHGSPERFNVTFPHPMMLRTVTLTMEDHAPIVVTAPETPAALSVGAPLPRLAPGTYRAMWVAEAPDGHRMTGTVSFMVH